MFDLISSHKSIQMLDRTLTLASQRMSLIAANLANIDTPHYHTQDFSFQDAFAQEMDNLDRQFSPGGRERHTAPTPIDPIDQKYERNDGNDVNLDRETMNLAKTQATYQLTAALMQAELKRLSGAIREAAK